MRSVHAADYKLQTYFLQFPCQHLKQTLRNLSGKILGHCCDEKVCEMGDNVKDDDDDDNDEFEDITDISREIHEQPQTFTQFSVSKQLIFVKP